MAEDIRIQDEYRAAKVIADIKYLLYLDETWTHALANAPGKPDQDVPVTRSLAEEMSRLLDNVIDHARWFDQILQDTSRISILEQWQKGLDETWLDDRLKGDIQGKIDRRGGILAFMRENTATVGREAPEQQKEIAIQVEKIQKGIPGHGDMKKTTECALLGMAAGVATACGVVGAGVWGWLVWRDCL